MSIILSLNKRKFKERAILLNDFLNDQTEDVPYFQWCLALKTILKQNFL